MSKIVKRWLLFVMVFALSQLLAYWFCLAGGIQFGTDHARMIYTITGILGLFAGLCVAIESVK